MLLKHSPRSLTATAMVTMGVQYIEKRTNSIRNSDPQNFANEVFKEIIHVLCNKNYTDIPIIRIKNI